jgi:RNA polymerase sigma factor (TIGR02999 family)
VTQLLRAWQTGDGEAAECLMPLVFGELRKIAASYLAVERRDHTLQPTALVNEAYLRLVGQTEPWSTRSHFFAIAAQMIRRILTDHARRTRASKRDHGCRVPLEEAGDLAIERPEELLDLDAALTSLAVLDPLKARIVEYRYFAGLTGEEIAGVEGVSAATIQRHWQLARAWLFRELKGENHGDA